MERVGTVIGCQRVGFAFERESGAANAIAITANQRAKIRTLGQIAIELVVTEHNVTQIALPVRHLERLDDATIGQDARFHPVRIAQRVNFHRPSVRQVAKPFFSDAADGFVMG